MRTREEIMQSATYIPNTKDWQVYVESMQKWRELAILEVLLDIRDLLQPISNEAQLHLQAKQVNH